MLVPRWIGTVQCLFRKTRTNDTLASKAEIGVCVVSDVVGKTSTRRRSRIPCVVVVKKITTRRREGVGVVVEKKEESRRTFNKNSCDLLTAITHTEILVARCIFLIKSESLSD